MSDSTASLKEIFASALECASAAERERYLNEACAGNAALRHDLEPLPPTTPSSDSFQTTAVKSS
jgi:hypothetical protein